MKDFMEEDTFKTQVELSSFSWKNVYSSNSLLLLESSQIRICPRETPNAINIDGITRCCKLDKDCASQMSQKGNISTCCNPLASDSDCTTSFCVDCKCNIVEIK